MPRKIDLHVHSTYSDGLHTPDELVRLAARQGVSVLALADHDTVDGIDAARTAGAAAGIEIVSAVELSVEFRHYHDVHLLGYMINYHDEEFQGILKQFRTRRDERGKQIITLINERLVAEGKETIHYEELMHSSDGSLGRPHIARRLIAIGAVREMQEAFEKYLEPCDVPKQYFPMEKALAEIRRIGGISVLAHPLSITSERQILRSVIEELSTMGLDGVEVYNNMSTAEDSSFLDQIAAGLAMITTGGSDFHGGNDALQIGELRSGVTVTDEHLRMLSDRHRQLFPYGHLA